MPGAAACVSPLASLFVIGGATTTNTIPIPFTSTLCGVTFAVQWLDGASPSQLGSSAVGHFVVGF